MRAPIIVSTWSFGAIGNKIGWSCLSQGGSAGDAVEQAANAIENDISVDSVGVGGLPDINGEVVLDAGFMESPGRWGSVLAVRNFRNPASIARRVADRFGRGIRVGEGAEEFADHEGFARANLLTESSSSWWQEMVLRGSTSLSPITFRDGSDGTLFGGSVRDAKFHDTVGIVALDLAGNLAAATSTSGIPLKPRGRVGDSAIPGHGIYVEPNLGAVAATGTGELISSCCASARILDALRELGDITGALKHGLRALALQGDPKEDDEAAFVCITREGCFAAASLRPGFRYCVFSENGPEIREADIVYFD